MKTSILAIGTELTSGQILNRNAHWISSKLKDFGVLNRLQLVVPDDHDQMLRGLEFCAQDVDLIFVTGGLGPTTDDFTRDVIAEWAGKKMQWSEDSWQHIVQRLSARNIAAKEVQRQQAYFPEGARVLLNQQGTANGFHLTVRHQNRDKDIYVLPGPPNEVKSIWEDWIHADLLKKTANLDPMIVRAWDTLGYGESDIAELAERALIGCSFEKGYRVHVPYVEVKLSYPRSRSTEATKWVDGVTEALRPMTITRDEENVANLLCHKLLPYEQIVIEDTFSGSLLWQRLQEAATPLLKAGKLNFETRPSADLQMLNVLILSLRANNLGHATAELKFRGQTKRDMLSSPYTAPSMKERERQYLTEMAMVFWLKQLV